MCKEQTSFVQLLEEIGESEIKSGASKGVDFGEPVRTQMNQFKDMKKEREILLESCRILHEDYAGKASLFASHAALAVSAIIAFISVLAIIITMVSGVVDADILFPRAMSQVAVLARIFGECREGRIPRSSAAMQA